MKKERCNIIMFLFAFAILFGLTTKVVHAETKYLENMPIVKKGQYSGNMGDSFVYPIGKHQYTRGSTGINGKSYSHGIEAWIARWNYSPEKSWA